MLISNPVLNLLLVTLKLSQLGKAKAMPLLIKIAYQKALAKVTAIMFTSVFIVHESCQMSISFYFH